MNNTISYLIHFLITDPTLASDTKALPKIGYTDDVSQFGKYDLVIIPSGFFNEGVYGTPESLPALPLKEWEGIPLLYGRPVGAMLGNTIVLQADIIASAYFLMTRYEEMVRRDKRDEHGRFPGKESLPYLAGFIHRPVVDEYRVILQRYLRRKISPEALVRPRLNLVELTHDVDAPFLYRSFKGFLRSILHGRPAAAFGRVDSDPYYTFPWLIEQDHNLSFLYPNVHTTLFFKAGGANVLDKPHYNPACKDIKDIARHFHKITQADIGLHVSYEAGMSPSVEILKKEKFCLGQALNIHASSARHHFLASRNPEDMEYLLQAGITHDYTMGYADIAGFRLGTSYTVKWINPLTRSLTDLNLHPLTIMDCTLEETDYMGLNYDDAERYCLLLIRNIKKVGGNLSLLWHNTSVMENNGGYLRRLYFSLISFLRKELHNQ